MSTPYIQMSEPAAPALDPESLGDLFKRHHGRLIRTAFQILRNSAEAEDAVQDGLLSALSHLSSFQGRAQPSTWLTRIVINAALMRLRHLRSLPMISFDQPISGDSALKLEPRTDRREDPEALYALRERRHFLGQAAAMLPPRLRSAFRLHYIQGLSIREAAGILRESNSLVKARLHRARRWLGAPLLVAARNGHRPRRQPKSSHGKDIHASGRDHPTFAGVVHSLSVTHFAAPPVRGREAALPTRKTA